MRQARLGRSETRISAIGMGCATLGREIDEQTACRILDYAVELGINFFDTAESYGGGNARAYRRGHLGADDVREVSGEMHSSERILGRWIASRGCRDAVTICTKVDGGNAPENITRAARDCSQRLGVDQIDVFMLHSPDEQVPIDESLDALHAEVTAGRVGVIGCSNFSGEQLREALDASRRLDLARFEVIESIYNMAHREVETDIFPVCAEQDMSFIAYSPLGAGFLTGKYTPDRRNLPAGTRFDVIPGHCDVYFSDEGFRTVDQLRKESERLGLSMAYLAGAWVTRNQHVDCTLFGARTCEHLDNAIAAWKAGA
jgi:aryl-alcohol dehydrogenase-like predicted oxidoreductase